MSRTRQRGLAIVLSQAVAQLALILVLPVLTRSYSVAEIGLFQVAMAVAMTLQPLATLRSEFAIPSMRFDATASQLVRRGYTATSLLGFLLFVIAAGAYLIGTRPMSVALLMAGTLILGYAWTAIDNAKLIRANETRRLALRNLLAGVIGAGFQLLVASVNAPLALLAVSLLAARVIAIALTWSSLITEDDVGAAEPVPYTVKRMSASISSGLVATATGHFLLFGSAMGHSASASGYTGVAQRVAGAPLSLLGQGLGQVMQSQIAPLIRENRVGLVNRLTSQVLILSLVATTFSLLLMFLAPILAEPLLGHGWAPAGTIVSILAIPMSFQLLVGPLMTVLPMLGKETILLYTQVGRFILVGLTVAICVSISLDLYELAMWYGIASMVGYAGMLIVVIQAARRHDLQAEELS